ncbi:cGMP-specific 3',5'-cyclic phosphodiesterase [Neodiprion pinetum]|uniref:cGMP-specific 3',5'-cyclic phosphodiesterase-like n=1 Tax=Neodiprion fabricii TaxID=2872261 RepID=UPI001ED97E84|nr:cGMP-specific 3',5'-cyclic phosphodiesterase-like [Neodiprion fabricii]XP_046433337.1 cGMP-specific 3',5'-cyclic phosphodiesterase-like [Neodiprion fabricii]XP_046490011.1 cGMP-specific 3',5'-cyclic phosphodiesterase-like [Neodiprion pinetum]XP_046490012.1 cGMP-specific 3',5'-cyclic phosphodiesterase-like [Neodiprion pinetum]
MDAEEMDEELPEAINLEVNHNNNLESFQAMKISTTPRCSKTPEREESALVGSAILSQADEEDGDSEIGDIVVPVKSNRSIEITNANVKTDFKEPEVARLCRSKRVSCQDTIPESDEDNRDSELTMERVGRYLEANQTAVEKWLLEKASPELRHRVQNPLLVAKRSGPNLHQEESSLSRCKRNSVTSDLFQSWLASSSPVKRSKSPSRMATTLVGRREELNQLDEGDLFMELIRDVANELDINILCHKILVNVGLLTHADRGSLFLAKGPLEDRYLVAKLFDVTQDTELEEAVQRAKREEIRIPFGVGIAGFVAQSKQIINIKDAYKDPRFNSSIDMRTGYKTTLILSMPICNYEGDVIGVAQIINKTNGSNEFTRRDVEVFQRYLTFCGIGIQNAQLFELSVQEYRRNQILLNLARSIFEEQNNLECLVTKIMAEAKELLKCERCAVYLLDLDCGEASHLEKIVERPGRQMQESRKPLSRRESNNIDMEDIFQQHHATNGKSKFTMVFEMENDTQQARVYRPNSNDLSSTLGQIARYVANTGQILNIGDVATWLKREVVDAGNEPIRSILCMPIVNGQRAVIGVAQLINKDNGSSFTDSDVSIFEAFAIFCGLGIHNTQMYESACKLMAKQKVALECLSYHATASNEDTVKLKSDTIPSAEKYNLYSFTFIDFDLTDEDTCRATVRMFKQCNLIQQFNIPYEVLCRWILSVKKNYRPVKYHNWRHALNVAQTMFAMLKTGKMERFMTDIEILGLLVACLCHDLDHRGTNNAFQMKTESPLAILYSTSTMEHHHFDQCVMILNSDSNNIFQSLSMEDYRTVMRIVENAILSTDLAMYFKKKNRFLELIEEGEFDWQSEEKKELLCGMMMTACDVSAIAKPWEVQHRVAKLVADEFFDQGDLERLQLKEQPVAMMDRERRDELPQMQVGFIDVICLPLYKVLSETFPWIEPLYEGTLENRKHWQDLAEKVEMGLTWIDRDTIEEPVEEFVSSEPKDIEFTVTTLNCAHTEKKELPDGAQEPQAAKSSLGRFASLRKGGRTLSKGVRHRLSRSLYARSSSEDAGKAKVLIPERKNRSKLCLLI